MNTLLLLVIAGIVMMFSSMNKVIAAYSKTIALLLITIVVVGAFIEYNSHIAWIKYAPHLQWLQWNPFNIVILFVLTIATWFYIALTGSSIANKIGNYPAEYFALIFFALVGAVLLIGFNSYLILFLGIEIISLPQFILAGSNKKDVRSSEAALKYFLMGSVASAILLMGIALIYGATGTLAVQKIFIYPYLFYIGLLFVMVGFLFKTSIAPFHFWAPDVYEGAPTPFVSFMSGILKVSVFLGFMRFFENAGIFSIQIGKMNTNYIHYILGIVIVLSLVISNFTAVFQQNIKRLMAYSSIAQASFMLFAIYGLNQQAKEGLFIYAIAYSFALVGIFSIINKMEDNLTIHGFKGFWIHNPFLALVLFVCFASLIGIPGTAGFVGKYYMLLAGIQSGCSIWLVVIAVTCAVVSAYYYLRIIQAIYFKQHDVNASIPTYKVHICEKIIYSVLMLIIILLGIFPTMPFAWMIYF